MILLKKVQKYNLSIITVTATLFVATRAFTQDRSVELFIEKHKFNLELIEMKPGEKITIKVTNKDKNFEEFESKSLDIEKFLKPGFTVAVTGRRA